MASMVLIVTLIAPRDSIYRPERGEDMTDMLSALYVADFADFICAVCLTYLWKSIKEE